MRHVHILIIVLFIGLGICLVGCKAKKSIQKYEETITRTERVERSADSIRIEQRETTSLETRRDEIENRYIRTTEYDSIGNVTKIQEEWRNRQSADVTTKDKQKESVTESVTEKEVIETDSSSVMVTEDSKIETDSRPVQGVEWFWLMLAIATAIIFVLYFFALRKMSKK